MCFLKDTKKKGKKKDLFETFIISMIRNILSRVITAAIKDNLRMEKFFGRNNNRPKCVGPSFQQITITFA